MSVLAEQLTARGLRVTPQRVGLLELLVEEGHLTVEELYRRASGRFPGLSATSLYKSLHALAEAGLVREVHLGAGPVRYDADGGQHHHHRVCRSCGSVADVPCLAGSGGCLAPHDLGGFGVEQVEITYRGRCVRCQARPSGPDEEAR